MYKNRTSGEHTVYRRCSVFDPTTPIQNRFPFHRPPRLPAAPGRPPRDRRARRPAGWAREPVALGRLDLAAPAPVAPGLIQLGVGFVYILFARLAFSRSRFASVVIVGVIILDILVESLLAREFGLNHVIILVALVLAIGGLRGANAIFSRHGKPRP